MKSMFVKAIAAVMLVAVGFQVEANDRSSMRRKFVVTAPRKNHSLKASKTPKTSAPVASQPKVEAPKAEVKPGMFARVRNAVSSAGNAVVSRGTSATSAVKRTGVSVLATAKKYAGKVAKATVGATRSTASFAKDAMIATGKHVVVPAAALCTGLAAYTYGIPAAVQTAQHVNENVPVSLYVEDGFDKAKGLLTVANGIKALGAAAIVYSAKKAYDWLTAEQPVEAPVYVAPAVVAKRSAKKATKKSSFRRSVKSSRRSR